MFEDESEFNFPQKSQTDQSKPRTLLNLIHKALTRNPEHHRLKYIKYENDITLYIIEKKPLYISDGDICLQASIGPPQKLNPLDPFNKLSTPFYAPHQRPHIVFNCHDSSVTEQPVIHASPYHPCYHYVDYQRFKTGRKNANVLVNCDTITLKDWTLILVNISNSGYYAPFIVINHHVKHRENYKLNRPVENILFSNSLTALLERCRVKDMHDQVHCVLKLPQKNYNLVYYMRYRQSTQKVGSMSSLVNLDRMGQILQYNKNKPSNYVPLGNLPRISLFKRPIDNKYINIAQVKLNYQNIEFNEVNLQASQSSVSVDLWSDEEDQEGQITRVIKKQMGIKRNRRYDSESDYEIEEERMGEQVEQRMDTENNDNNIIDIQSDESEPDLLKTLYKNTLKKSTI